MVTSSGAVVCNKRCRVWNSGLTEVCRLVRQRSADDIILGVTIPVIRVSFEALHAGAGQVAASTPILNAATSPAAPVDVAPAVPSRAIRPWVSPWSNPPRQGWGWSWAAAPDHRICAKHTHTPCNTLVVLKGRNRRSSFLFWSLSSFSLGSGPASVLVGFGAGLWASLHPCAPRQALFATFLWPLNPEPNHPSPSKPAPLDDDDDDDDDDNRIPTKRNKWR